MSAAKQHGDFGVTSRRWIPFSWRARKTSARTPERVSAMNQVNEKRLKTLLEHETRDNPSPEIATLEALVIEVLHTVKQPPTARSVVLSANDVEWIDTATQTRVSQGDFGIIQLCLNPELPYEVEFFAEVTAIEKRDSGWHISAELMLRSEYVVDLYQQLVFIYYRRERREQKLESGEELSH